MRRIVMLPAVMTVVVWFSGAFAAMGDPSAASTSGDARTEKVVPYLEGEVVVRFASGVEESDKQALKVEHQLTLTRNYPRLRCERLLIPAGRSVESVVDELLGDPRIDCVQPNFIYRAAVYPEDPALLDRVATPNQWGIFRTFTLSLWRAIGGGSGQVIAFLDTGADLTHPDLAANKWLDGGGLNGWDFVNDDNDPSDDNGHGTHVTGIACAAANTVGIAGTAWEAKFMSVKVLNDHGTGVSTDISEGILYAADHGADVANMSLESLTAYDAATNDCLIRSAVADAYSAGVVLVAASGNGGGAQVRYPAALEEVIAVGAVDTTPAVWINSNYGSALDVVAPGVDVWSTTMGSGWGLNTGTSMASPFVAGIAADILTAFPGIKAWEVERYLRFQTHDIDTHAPGESGNRDGYGMVSFGTFKDYSNGALPVAWSKNMSWERLGDEVTGESAIADATPSGTSDGDDYLPDLDGVTNAAGTGEDGDDDGFFPVSHAKLPFLPPHLYPALPPPPVDVKLSVSHFAGPRYAAGATIAYRGWVDWNSNNVFTDAGEQYFSNTTPPGGWGADQKTVSTLVTLPPDPITPGADDHIRGNPLRVRARVYGPGEGPGGPNGEQNFGEVEDQLVVNFVEDFDAPDFHASIFATSDGVGWGVAPDVPWGLLPDVPGGPWPVGFPWDSAPPHHATWHYYGTRHTWCFVAAVDEKVVFPEMAKPPLDLRETTRDSLRVWIAHAAVVSTPCLPGGVDSCRVSVLRSTTPGGATTEFPLYNIPDGNLEAGIWNPGNITLDLSPYAGYYIRIVVRHDTDREDGLLIDDLIVWGYDHLNPQDVAWNAGSLTVNRQASVTWTHPDDNNPPVRPLDPANIHGARLLGPAVAWTKAWRLTPRDFAGGSSAFPVPGTPGTMSTAGFYAPTTFPDLNVAFRTGDEVTNNTPTPPPTRVLSVTPTFNVSVLETGSPYAGDPGDTVAIPFAVTNAGNSLDAIRLVLTDDKDPDWILCIKKWTHVLEAGTGTLDSVKVRIPPAAVGPDTCRVVLKGTSLSDATKTSSDTALVVVGAPPVCNHYADHDVGNVRFTVTDQGIAGFMTSGLAPGSGFIFPKTGPGSANRLLVGSFVAGTDSTYCLNRDYDNDPVKDWMPAGCINTGDVSRWAPAHMPNQAWRGIYTDAGHPSPRGLRVIQDSYSWALPPDDDFVIMVFQVTNTGASPIANVWLGQFMDWDLDATGPFPLNRGTVDAARNTAYMWKQGGPDSTRVGMRLLAGPNRHLTFIRNLTYIRPDSTLHDNDRYHFLSGDLPAYRVTDAPLAADWSMMGGIGPFTIAPGDTARIALALIGGSTQSDFLANADAALALWGWRTDVAELPARALPTSVQLLDPQPNPAVGATALAFELPAVQSIRLEVYDVAGRLVSRVAEGMFTAGRHAVNWDGSDRNRSAVKSGIYFVRLQAGSETRTRKIMIMR